MTSVIPGLIGAWDLHRLVGIGVGGVYEPPTVDSFSHVQFFMPVQGANNYRPLLIYGAIQCDQTAIVRVAFQDGTLASADGIVGPADRNETGGQIKMQANSETNVAQETIDVDLMRIRCPADVWVPLPSFEWQSGAAGQGLTCNPIVTGVGIAIYGCWRESSDLGAL